MSDITVMSDITASSHWDIWTAWVVFVVCTCGILGTFICCSIRSCSSIQKHSRTHYLPPDYTGRHMDECDIPLYGDTEATEV